MTRLIPLFPFLAVVGCAGSVQLEEVDPFGPTASALWIDWKDSDYQSILLTNVVGACGKYQAYAEAYDDFQDAMEDIDVDDYCEEGKEPSLKLARAANELFHEGTHSLSLAVYEDGGTEPDEETYEVGDAEHALSGSLAYLEYTPWATILSDWDEDGDWEDGCGIDEDDLETEGDYWSLTDGELEIKAVNDEQALSATLDGELSDDDGDDAGDIAASFTATWCEVDA